MIMILRTPRALVMLPLLFLIVSADALAWGSCAAIFSTTFADSQTENLAGCLTCHSNPNGGPFNRYGADLRANGAQGVGSTCNAADFAQALLNVQDLDSDGEGNINSVEIAASAQPAWCDSDLFPGCTNPGTSPTGIALDPAPANEVPVAVAGGPYEGIGGATPVQFDGSGSSDADTDPLSYAWTFGDGNNGTGVAPIHMYVAAGDYEVRLVVSDGKAESAPSITSAAIAAPTVNLAPVANPGGPYSGQPGVALSFNGSASADPNDDPITYFWDFGDGSMGDGVSPSHAYGAEGVYTASLTVNDGALDSLIATTSVNISVAIAQSDGEVLYNVNCLGCHGDPWVGPAVDETLFGLRRVSGSRSCNIEGSIFGTSVFPNGVPEMQHLQGLSDTEIVAMADYLNSREVSGEWRYVSTCAGCHGNDGSGGRVDEDVNGDSAGETREAIAEESEMRYLACMPQSDIASITSYLLGPSANNDGDGIEDDENDRASSSGGGTSGLPLIVLLSFLALRNSRPQRVIATR